VHVAHVNVVQPRRRIEPEALLQEWPTLGAVARAVRRAGAAVTVVQAFHRDAERILDGVRYRFVADPRFPGRATGLMPGRVARAVRALAADVIHLNGLDTPRHARALGATGIPMLAQDHASAPGRRSGLRHWSLVHAAGVAFTDRAQATPFFEQRDLPPGIALFDVPESSTDFTPGNLAVARAETGLHGDPAVLWVGRLDANKDPLTILDAIEIAAARLPNLHLWMAFHEQPLLAEVKARVAGSPSLTGRVHLIGRVDHPRIETLCRAADIFLLGSHSEGSGYALIEAIACGATPVVSDIPSFRRLTGDGAIGRLAPVGDVAAFARALIDLAARPRDALRQAARLHFETALTFDQVGVRLCEIYRALIAGRG
jgi:glycosyltransferase involved in cell wall biosynthesis